MSLANDISKQYKKRHSKEGLYQESPYVKAVQAEIQLECNELLKSCFKNLETLTLLEFGAGNGTNAYMFESLGIKRSNISFNELLKDRISNIKTNFPSNEIHEGDAIKVNFGKKYDIIFQSTVFTSILSEEDRIKLAKKMWELLNPGGVILWYDFIYNNPKNADVRKVSALEVKQLFNEFSFSIIKKVTLAPPIGRKVGKYYKLFNMELLRSHILAVFQKVR